ncbi:MAG: YggS family pyridoxal phosphate-dependent enzyme [Oscillospiraceae bacterium]|jgi:pyridoxal phosphate enzyme (YggS family)|nr:YggS family pyridoxal phosphate-dependent enzyme [Oscillospiraceae bacterium]
MTDIAGNVRAIREEIERAAEGREVCLLAASKTKGPELIREAIKAGVDAVGENRVNEMTEKAALGAYEGAPLHFIGRLQKNKVKYVVGRVELIHSVDSPELMQLIGRKAVQLGTVQDILLEINIGREESKGGFAPEETERAVELAAGTEGVRLLGLMAIPPVGDVFSGKYTYFDEMYKLFVDIRAKKYDNTFIKVLSMGMSGDFTRAIKAGSNMVRVGSAIFGSR